MNFFRHLMLAPLLAVALVALPACGKKEAPAPVPRAASATASPAPTSPASTSPASTSSAPTRPAPASTAPPDKASAIPAAEATASGGPSKTADDALAAGAAAASATAAAAGAMFAQASEPFKVAFVYVGAVGDGGWTSAHDRGRKEMEAAFGGEVKTTYVESTPENTDADRVFRDLASQGNKLIFGTSYGYMESMARVAKEFPDVKWEHANGFKSDENLRAYGVRTDESAYLAGIIAGKLTRTDTLGFVASIAIPEVLRNVNAFTLGAQSVNPSVRTKVAWVNKRLDPARESEAAQSLIKGGADVLLQNTDSTAPLQVAEKAGKYAFGWNSDMRAASPKAYLGSSIINWGPYYTKAVRQALDGTWKAQSSRWGLKQGAVDLVNLSDVVPADVKAVVEEKKKAIADGSFRIWKGPMLTSEDKEILATGAVGDAEFISGIMFYVKGVEGKIPAVN